MTYWRGIHKVMEECGELVTVLAKLCVVPVGKHWDEEPHTDGRKEGAPPLRQRLIEESGDVLAAIEYLNMVNLTPYERFLVEQRKQFKLTRYYKWRLSGVESK